MRDMTIGTITRVLVGVLGCIAWAGANVAASPIAVDETFSTSGTVGATGITGTPVVSFQGVNDGSLTTGSAFNLGQFVVGPIPPGTSTTYSNTPFELTFTVKIIDGAVPPNNDSPIVLNGWLNGKVTNDSLSGLHENYNILVFTPGYGPPYQTIFAPFHVGKFTNYLNILSGDGNSPIQAEVNVTQSVPEPVSIALFAFVGMFIMRLRSR